MAKNLEPLPGRKVLFLNRGATVNGTQSDTALTVYAGATRFAHGDVVQIAGDLTKVAAVNGTPGSDTILTVSPSLDVIDGDRILRLENDNAGVPVSPPLYDGSSLNIYDRPDDSATPISTNMVETDADGEYAVYASPGIYDKVILDENDQAGTNSQVEPDIVLSETVHEEPNRIVVDGINYTLTSAGVLAAMNDLPETGGTVVIDGNVTAWEATLVVPKSYIKVRGYGGIANVPKLTASAGLNGPMIQQTSAVQEFHMENVEMDGNGSGNTSGTCLEVHGFAQTIFRDCFFRRGKDSCIHVKGAATLTFSNCWISGFNGTAADTTDLVLIDDTSGITSSLNFFNCTIEGAISSAVKATGLTSASHISFWGCHWENAPRGLWLNDCGGAVVTVHSPYFGLSSAYPTNGGTIDSAIYIDGGASDPRLHVIGLSTTNNGTGNTYDYVIENNRSGVNIGDLAAGTQFLPMFISGSHNAIGMAPLFQNELVLGGNTHVTGDAGRTGCTLRSDGTAGILRVNFQDETNPGRVVLYDDNNPMFDFDADNKQTIHYDDNGGQWIRGRLSEEITLSTGGTTTDSSANLLPANSIIDAVTYRVTTTITTAANFDLGDAIDPVRFLTDATTLTAGNTGVALEHVGEATTSGAAQSAAAVLRITTNVNPGAGAIRVTVFFRQFVAPTS